MNLAQGTRFEFTYSWQRVAKLAQLANSIWSATGLTLLTNAQATNDVDVSLRIDLAEIIEQPATFAYETKQTAATRVILLMRTHVPGETINPGREEGDLYLGRTGIALFTAIRGDQFLFAVLRDCHWLP